MCDYLCTLTKHNHFLKSSSHYPEVRLDQYLKDEYIESDSAMILQSLIMNQPMGELEKSFRFLRMLI